MILKPQDHILFFGDSVTDCSRRHEVFAREQYGHGYVDAVAGSLSCRLADWRLKFTNSGISGNRIGDLEARLESDVLAIRPSVVSILIGINDTWRRYDRNTTSEIPQFEAAYERICQRLKDELDARLVICEPFLLHTPADRAAWREDLNPRIDAVRRIAAKFADALVPLDGAFAAAACVREPEYWLYDGVHPTAAGHALIAQHWLGAVGAQ